ncbi:MAG TPA: ComF family protein [Desulfosarcina sp.]|nr:ComF family protein [Desulfosarcina sp.]
MNRFAPAVYDWLKRIGGAWLDAVFPPRCAACNAFFTPPRPVPPLPPLRPDLVPDLFRRIMAPHFCDDCLADAPVPRPPACFKCGLLWGRPSHREEICPACRSMPKAFGAARAFGPYEGALQTAIHAFKYAGRLQLARPLGMLLWAGFRQWWDPYEFDVVAPVPLHAVKFRERGFNQSYLMLRIWPKLVEQTEGRPLKAAILRDVLVRSRSTGVQAGMDREARAANVRGAFSVPDPDRVGGLAVLLVDDVYTTGTTADACARTLMGAGARRVDVLTLAQTPRRV